MTDKQLAVINVVGLTKSLIGEHTPFLQRLIKTKALKPLKGAFPAVTTTAQSAMLTGKYANDHGIVGNGWYFPDLGEIGFWKQSNQLVQSPKIWQVLKDQHKGFTCANSFWWYNMYSGVDYSITPRPHYPADGRKIPDLYSFPSEMHKEIESTLGVFPFFNFWGPKAGIEGSEWIAKAAVELQKKHQPNLHLIYLPHLDYNLQRLGPSDPKIAEDLQKIDRVIEKLCTELDAINTEYILVSEYGISDVNQAIHINKILRKAGYLSVRNSLGLEMLDCGASAAFAASDHQVAHVYVNDKSKLQAVKKLLEEQDGIAEVLDSEGMKKLNIQHQRSGDLIAISEPKAWFTYYYWFDDKLAPDFARTVDIHRKPGYDPVEMFLDPDNPFIMLKVIWKLLLKKLGFRSLFSVVPLKPELIKGSHGRLEDDQDNWPVVIADQNHLDQCEQQTDVFKIMSDFFANDQ